MQSYFATLIKKSSTEVQNIIQSDSEVICSKIDNSASSDMSMKQLNTKLETISSDLKNLTTAVSNNNEKIMKFSSKIKNCDDKINEMYSIQNKCKEVDNLNDQGIIRQLNYYDEESMKKNENVVFNSVQQDNIIGNNNKASNTNSDQKDSPYMSGSSIDHSKDDSVTSNYSDDCDNQKVFLIYLLHISYRNYYLFFLDKQFLFHYY